MAQIIADQYWLIYVAAFLAIFLFCVGLNQLSRTRTARRQFIEKIRMSGEDDYVDEASHETGLENRKSKLKFPRIFKTIGQAADQKLSVDYSTSKLRFLRAGIKSENATANFWGMKILLVVLLPLGFAVLRIGVFKLVDYQLTLIIIILLALLGFYLPDIWLRYKTDKRKEIITKALPDSLDLLVICVEAGMGLDSAINRVAKETRVSSPELSDEFSLINLELRAGKSRQDALRNLALRTNVDEINSLSTLLIQTDKFGTSMADALRVYSDTFRTQRYQKAEEIAAKLPVKLVVPLILFIFPALFVVILGPAVIQIYRAFLG